MKETVIWFIFVGVCNFVLFDIWFTKLTGTKSAMRLTARYQQLKARQK